MSAPADGDLVPRASRLLRLPKPPPDFVPDGWRPSSKQFEPSSMEKKASPVRVSVWDQGRTSNEQARAFRVDPTIVLGLMHDDLLQLAANKELHEQRAVYEPLEEELQRKPGADGHAGIEGLYEKKKLGKVAWRALLDDVAALAEVLVLPG